MIHAFRAHNLGKTLDNIGTVRRESDISAGAGIAVDKPVIVSSVLLAVIIDAGKNLVRRKRVEIADLQGLVARMNGHAVLVGSVGKTLQTGVGATRKNGR